MITYKLDFIGGGSRPGYYILKYWNYDNDTGVDTIAVIYDGHIAYAIVEMLNSKEQSVEYNKERVLNTINGMVNNKK